MRDWLKKLREENDYTMKDMGRKLGISESYYCSIENGRRQRRMDLVFIGELAGIFGVPISILFAMEQEWAKEAGSRENNSFKETSP